MSLLASGACLHVGGKGAVKVVGSVASPNNQAVGGCNLGLIRASDDTLIKRRDVGPRFEEVLFIPPIRDQYYLTVACQGTSMTYRSPIYELEGMKRHDNPIVLGRIVLAK
jgi:hypothetical protein